LSSPKNGCVQKNPILRPNVFHCQFFQKNPKGVAETQQKRPIFLFPFPFSRHTNTHAKREREIEISFVTKKKIFGGSETRKFQKYWQNIFFLLLLFFVEAVSWILKFRDEEKT